MSGASKKHMVRARWPLFAADRKLNCSDICSSPALGGIAAERKKKKISTKSWMRETQRNIHTISTHDSKKTYRNGTFRLLYRPHKSGRQLARSWLTEQNDSIILQRRKAPKGRSVAEQQRQKLLIVSIHPAQPSTLLCDGSLNGLVNNIGRLRMRTGTFMCFSWLSHKNTHTDREK